MRLESGGATLLRGADASLEAEVEADLANGRYTLSHNTLRLNAIALTLDGWVDLADPDAVKMELRAGCDRVRFKDVLSLVPAFYTRDFRGLTASGELSLAAWVAGELRGQSLPAFEVSLEVADGMFQQGSADGGFIGNTPCTGVGLIGTDNAVFLNAGSA